MTAPARDPKPETLYEPRFPHPGVYLIPVILFPTLGVLGGLLLRKYIPGLPEWIIPVAIVTVTIALVGKWVYDIHRIRRVIRAHGRFLCLNCHYPLQGLPDTGTCPECDYPYDRATNERRWRTWEETVNKGKPLA